jgi:pyroglutamyl-peptidase
LSSPARTLLVTGFEPFGGETLNASWEAAQKLEGWRHGEYVAVARLLPCAYDASVKELIQAIETLRPDALLMTGQAARRGAVCVERFARNLDDATAPDNEGALRRGLRISRDAPEWLEAAAPVRAIVRAVNEAGIRTRVSRNAGTFVCNHLYLAPCNIWAPVNAPFPPSSCICP